jgi:hypothetical protein
MRFDVAPTGRVAHLPPRPPATQKTMESDGFAQVYDLSKARRGAPDVPPAVWDEVDRAAQVATDMEAAGRVVRFRAAEPGGRVRAELCDADGHVLRPLSLGEIITIGTTEPPTAA